MVHEIYRIPLSYKLEEMYFKDIVKLIYENFKSIVFALELTCNNKTIIWLNPSQFWVSNIMQNNKVFIYVICPDKKIADDIETIYMSKEEENQYWVK